MNMPRLTLVMLVLAVLIAAFAEAKPRPAPEPTPTLALRDGCVTGSIADGIGAVNIDLFSVPAGMELVLTDLQYDMNTLITKPNPQVVDEVGTLRWMKLGRDIQGDRMWTTGITFAATKIVRMRLHRPNNVGYPYTICWAGYLRSFSEPALGAVEFERSTGLQPLGFKIGPNPMGDGATVWFKIDRDGPIKLAIYDAQGRLVRDVSSGHASAGEQSVRWDGRDRNGKAVESGLYFARLDVAGEKHSAKIIRVE